jgi:ribosome biogenesis GTPase / thiamine phosphate phosphatase
VVTAVDRGRWGCRLDDGREVTAMRARELGRTPVVVGDRVSLVGDTGGGPDVLVRIVRVAERRSVLRRTPDDTDPVERVVVANADLLVIVTSLADPPPRPRLIDRCLVAAYDGGLEPLLCLTKIDLAEPAELLAAYRPLGVQSLATGPGQHDPGVAALRARLAGSISVLFGQSGVGKSTLVNRLVPDALRATAGVSEGGQRKGRHTSSSVVALDLPGGGIVIDTPGVRSFGLGAVSPARVLSAFPDLAGPAEHCPPGCTHAATEPRCALDAAEGVEPLRVASLRRLLAGQQGED